MKELIGKQFKRNVYGPSLWTDTITEITVAWQIPGSLKEYKRSFLPEFGPYQIPQIMVKGEKHWFPLTEIIILREMDFAQKLSANKEELHDIIKEEWINKQQFKKE